MTTTKKHPSTATPNQEDKKEVEGTGDAGQGQQKRGLEQATKPPGTKSTGRSISSAKNITSYLQKQQVGTSSLKRDKRGTDKERKTEGAEDGMKLQESLSRAQATLDRVKKHREIPLKSDQKEPSTVR